MRFTSFLLCFFVVFRSKSHIVESEPDCKEVSRDANGDAFIWADQVLIRNSTLFPSAQRRKFSSRKTVMIGDSLTRRLAATIAMYLNVTEDCRTAHVDFGERTRLGEGGHNKKDWSADIVPYQFSPIRLAYYWRPVFPPDNPESVTKLLLDYSTVVNFVSPFWQTGRNPLMVPISPINWTENVLYVQRLCKALSPGSLMFLGVSPPGDIMQVRELKARYFGRSASSVKLKHLNSKTGVARRRSNIRSFNREYHARFSTMYRQAAFSEECEHVAVKLLDHFELFRHRTSGENRDVGDTLFHLGKIARIQRALDIFRHTP